MQRLGTVDVEVRDGFIVAASEGGQSWSAERRGKMPRLLTHLLIMAAVAAPFMVTAASAHQANLPGRSQGRLAMLASTDVAAEKEHRVVAALAAPISPAGAPAVATAATVPGAPAVPAVDPARPNPERAPIIGGGGHFSWGWCTWYVSTRRFVPWMGNAIDWFGNAAAMGYPEGSTPRAGAIMVTRESGWGHVAYVESVDPDGSWTVSEMNFRGFGVTSTRHITPGHARVVGFIY